MNRMSPKNRIRLSRETLRTLTAAEAARVPGGLGGTGKPSDNPWGCVAAGPKSTNDPTACFAGR